MFSESQSLDVLNFSTLFLEKNLKEEKGEGENEETLHCSIVLC